MLKWIIGDFFSGNISEANSLPAIPGDRITTDVNSTDTASLDVPFNALPQDWRTYLMPPSKFVALVDTERDWTDGVIWAGYINKTTASARKTVTCQLAGPLEYAAQRVIGSVYNGVANKPGDGAIWVGDNYTDVLASMIAKLFSREGMADPMPKPPAVLGTFKNGDVALPTKVSASFQNSEMVAFSEALNEVRDVTSDTGNEFYFKARWSDASKSRIVWDVYLGTAAKPHINYDSTEQSAINLDDEGFKSTDIQQSFSSDKLATRLIAQSKVGDTETNTGSDYQAYTVGLVGGGVSNTILLDQTFNPGVELTDSEMADQLKKRLDYMTQPDNEATYKRVAQSTSELLSVLGLLGKRVSINRGSNNTYFSLIMRVVSIEFSASNYEVTLTLMKPQARYPKLPLWRRGGPGRDNGNTNIDRSQTKPITPRDPENMPKPPTSGGGTPDVPDFTNHSKLEKESILTFEGMNKVARASDEGAGFNSNWMYETLKPKTIRDLGKWIYGLGNDGMSVQADIKATGQTPTPSSWIPSGSFLIGYDLESNVRFNTKLVAQEPATQTKTTDIITAADTAANLKVRLPYSDINAKVFSNADSDLLITGLNGYTPSMNKLQSEYIYTPPGSSERYTDWSMQLNGGQRSIDMQIVVSEEWVYLIVLYSITNTAFVNADKFTYKGSGGAVSQNVGARSPLAKWRIKDNTWRAPRTASTGAVGAWTDMGEMFKVTDPSGSEATYWNPGNLHIIDGKFQGFGGYYFKQNETNGLRVSRSLPSFNQTFYSYSRFEMELDGSNKKALQPIDFPFEGPVRDFNEGTGVSNIPSNASVIGNNLLASRVRDGKVLISYSNGFTNIREYLQASTRDYTFKRVMIADDGPSQLRYSGEEFVPNIQTSLSAELVGNNVVDLVPGGIWNKIAASPNIKNRNVVTLRGKIGHDDTLRSELTFPDTYMSTTLGTGTDQMNYDLPLLLNSNMVCQGHVFRGLSSIQTDVLQRANVNSNNQYNALQWRQTNLWSSFYYMTKSWLITRAPSTSYYYDGKNADPAWHGVVFNTLAKDTQDGAYLMGDASGVNNGYDFWWKIWNGKVYAFFDMSVQWDANTAGYNSRTVFAKFGIKDGKLT